MTLLISFLVSLPGLMLVIIGISGWHLWRRKRRLAMAYKFHCALCRTSFEDALIEDLGPVPKADKQRLDRFQRRFASFRVRCGACGAVNICTADGTPFTASIPE